MTTPSPPPPAVSIVIRCFNEGKHIERLLQGIAEQTVRDLEIVVVDSGSTDDTLDIVNKWRTRVVSIRPEEFSFGLALNRGCAAARGEILVFASAHVYPVYRNWLERLIAPLNDPDVALSYGRQCGDERSKFSERQLFTQWFPAQSTARQPHPFCNNANAAIRRAAWERQPFDETVTGLEDLHWAKNALQQGRHIAYVADAMVVHVHDESAAQIANRYRREAIAMRALYPAQTFSALHFVALLSGNVASDGYHALLKGELFKELRSILRFRLMQFWGTYQGYAQEGPVPQHLRWRFYYPTGFTRSRTRGATNHDQQAIDYDRIGAER